MINVFKHLLYILIFYNIIFYNIENNILYYIFSKQHIII